MSIPPLSKLGSDYVITNYYSPIKGSYTGPMGFGITGMMDNVTILITINSPTNVFVTYNGRNYTNGQTISDTLNKYETIQVNHTSSLNINVTILQAISFI